MKKRVISIIVIVLVIAGIIAVIAVSGGKGSDSDTVTDNFSETVTAESEATEKESKETKVKTTKENGDGKISTLQVIAYLCDDKDYCYATTIIFDTVDTKLVPGKKVDLPYYDHTSDAAAFDGLPIQFSYDITESPKFGYRFPNKIVISYEGGRCSTWANARDPEYFESGKEFQKPITVYWSCFDGSSMIAAEKGTITADYYIDDELVGSRTVVLTRGSSKIMSSGTEVFRYSATLQKF